MLIMDEINGAMTGRLQQLHKGLVKAIPRIPNNRSTLDALRAKSVGELLIYFLCWRLRFVAPRPRIVGIDPAVTGDARWTTWSGHVQTFLTRVEAGEDLTPWLSLQAHSRAFSLAATQSGPDVDRWKDKDFLLFVMGLHHFHLGQQLEKKGYAGRTNEIIFAEVTREQFDIVALTDHDVFGNNADGSLTPERERLWELFDSRRARNMLPGFVYISGGYGGLGITMSGHPTYLVLMAQKYGRIIREIDPKLDDPIYVASLYPGDRPVNPPKLSWRFNHLDLVICDEANQCFFTLGRGPA